MITSLNRKPDKVEFESLLNETLLILHSESKRNSKDFLSYLGVKLEKIVFEIMSDRAVGTPFENSITLISGQRFPDIVAGRYYGLEVKTTSQNHWTTTGNSILEGTRVNEIERIYLLFGKMVDPVEFKCKPYESCLSEVVVTHSPRYLINMELKDGETIFDKLNIPYDVLRKESNPVRPIIDYYRKFLKRGEELWWLDEGDSKSKGIILKQWRNLPLELRTNLLLESMALFPGIFGNHPDKFSEVGVWLVNMHGVYCPNVRDVFTAGGQGQINWGDKIYYGIPKIVVKLIYSLSEIRFVLKKNNVETLSNFWGQSVTDVFSNWIDLVVMNSKHLNLKFDLKGYLKEFLYK